jgi:RNA polymerase sigma-B factor
VKHTRDELTHELSETPTVAQIAARLDVSELAVLDAIRAGDDLRPASLDGWFGDDGGTEVPIIDGSFDQCLDRLQVQASLPNLDDRERLVLKRVYFDGLTQSDVAVELEVSQMQVSRLLAQAVAKLRR